MRPADDAPFKDWIATSAVRAKPPLTDFALGRGDDLASVRWFVFGAQDELLSHPALRPLGLAERNRLAAARLVQFLDDMTLTEHRIVNTAAQAIAQNRLKDFLPEPMALDALKLYTDEGYHAFFTAHASRAVRQCFSLAARDEPSLKIAALEAWVAEAPSAQRDLAWFMVGFVGETMITKAIVDAMRGTAHSGLQRLLLAHLEDEWVHARYFAQAFALVWKGLDASARAHWGGQLPRVMAAFHARDPRLHGEWLEQAGLDAAARERVLDRLCGGEGLTTRTRRLCANTLQVLERCSAFKHKAVRERFVEAGLIDPDHRR